MKFIDRQCYSVRKTIIGDLWFIGNNFTNGFTDGQSE